jgi:hypothetical protein
LVLVKGVKQVWWCAVGGWIVARLWPMVMLVHRNMKWANKRGYRFFWRHGFCIQG